MKKRIIFCSALVGFYMQAMPAQSEDLKAYFEKQKAELVQSFTAPASGTDITLVLLDGEEKTGVIRYLSETGIQILSDNTLATFRKHELDEGTCAKLFAEEYAHVEAMKRTRTYKRGHTKRAKDSTHKGSLSVSSKMDRDGTRDTSNRESDSGGVTETEIKVQTEVRNLKVLISNQTTHPDRYTLKWYFFAQDLGKEDVYIQSRGSKEVEVKGRSRVTHEVKSKGSSIRKASHNYTACCGKTAASENKTGVEEKGYLVVLKCGDEVIDRKASDKRYMDPDWIKLCQ